MAVTDDIEKLSDVVDARRFEYADDKSYKFWTIALEGRLLITRFGRIGSTGQEREVLLSTPTAAKRDYLKRIDRKLKAGYQEKIPTEKQRLTSDDVWARLEEHEPFLQAILETPDDVDGFAIYADWLAEQQDPLGEFTHLQLALEDPSLPMYRRPKIENSAKSLQQKHARRWLGTLARWLMDGGLASHWYRFDRGQLAAIHCQVLDLQFADALRRSPHCRMLRELAVCSSEQLSHDIQIDGQAYRSGQDYGFATLLGADFSNLREFTVGVIPDEWLARTQKFSNVTSMIELIESMPRLESLTMAVAVDWRRLLALPLTNLRSLRLSMEERDLPSLSASEIMPRLQVFGIQGRLSNRMIEQLIEIPGFAQLSEFSCSEVSTVSVRVKEQLQETGVVLRIITMEQ